MPHRKLSYNDEIFEILEKGQMGLRKLDHQIFTVLCSVFEKIPYGHIYRGILRHSEQNCNDFYVCSID